MIQFIENAGKRQYAIIPYALYQRLAAIIEDAEDIQALEEFYKQDDGFRIPGDLLQRELAGESPVKLWREHKGMTQKQLADMANMEQLVLAQVENGSLSIPEEDIAKLAQILAVPKHVLIA